MSPPKTEAKGEAAMNTKRKGSRNATDRMYRLLEARFRSLERGLTAPQQADLDAIVTKLSEELGELLQRHKGVKE
jgi:hypothetical protein